MAVRLLPMCRRQLRCLRLQRRRLLRQNRNQNEGDVTGQSVACA